MIIAGCSHYFVISLQPRPPPLSNTFVNSGLTRRIRRPFHLSHSGHPIQDARLDHSSAACCVRLVAAPFFLRPSNANLLRCAPLARPSRAHSAVCLSARIARRTSPRAANPVTEAAAQLIGQHYAVAVSGFHTPFALAADLAPLTLTLIDQWRLRYSVLLTHT